MDFQSLPREVFGQILQRLHFLERIETCQLVSKYWKRVLQEDFFKNPKPEPGQGVKLVFPSRPGGFTRVSYKGYLRGRNLIHFVYQIREDFQTNIDRVVRIISQLPFSAVSSDIEDCDQEQNVLTSPVVRQLLADRTTDFTCFLTPDMLALAEEMPLLTSGKFKWSDHHRIRHNLSPRNLTEIRLTEDYIGCTPILQLLNERAELNTIVIKARKFCIDQSDYGAHLIRDERLSHVKMPCFDAILLKLNERPVPASLTIHFVSKLAAMNCALQSRLLKGKFTNLGHYDDEDRCNEYYKMHFENVTVCISVGRWLHRWL